MSDKPEPDIGLFFATTPPIVVPLSQRAKDRMRLPEGVDCAIFLEEPEKVLAMFGEDYLVLMLKEYSPKLIKPMSVQRLH